MKCLQNQTNEKMLHNSGINTLLVSASCGNGEVVALLSSLEIISLETFHTMLNSTKKGNKIS